MSRRTGTGRDELNSFARHGDRARGGRGLASRGRISLLRDGTATVSPTFGCRPWFSGRTVCREHLFNNGRNDASGVALDAEGNLYFSAAPTSPNPFLVDKEGKGLRPQAAGARFSKVSPDRKRREIVSTGIRFAVSLALASTATFRDR
mgnify:CR=1 FL=1